jgi:hypothetical protein
VLGDNRRVVDNDDQLLDPIYLYMGPEVYIERLYASDGVHSCWEWIGSSQEEAYKSIRIQGDESSSARNIQQTYGTYIGLISTWHRQHIASTYCIGILHTLDTTHNTANLTHTFYRYPIHISIQSIKFLKSDKTEFHNPRDYPLGYFIVIHIYRPHGTDSINIQNTTLHVFHRTRQEFWDLHYITGETGKEGRSFDTNMLKSGVIYRQNIRGSYTIYMLSISSL